MAGIRRPRKKYGPVNGIGRRGPWIPPGRKKGAKAPPMPSRIPAGTVVYVRKLNSGAKWVLHTTKREVNCHGHLWRTKGWYGFAFGEYEIKAKIGTFL